jgi:hypothetical protein
LVFKREIAHMVLTTLQSLGVFIASFCLILNLVIELMLFLIVSYPRGTAVVFIAACALCQ